MNLHKEKSKILITGKLHDVALQLLKTPPHDLALPFETEIVYLPDADRDVILKEIEDTRVLISRSETDVDALLLRAGKQLSVVARAAVGYGNIDCDLATDLGILVLNTPGKNTNSAAELTIGLLLALFRNIPQAHVSTAAGGWNRHQFGGIELGGKTIGLIGLGNVGHRVAKFARGFDMRVLAYDPYLADTVFRKNQVERRNSIKDLLREVDIVSIHVPLNKETKNIIQEHELRLMKKGSYVLNAARGGLINEADLFKLLDEGHIAGAALDTFENEPHPMASLVAHPHVVVTPHIGASTEEAQYRIGECVAKQVLKALRDEIVDFPVNLPHVAVLGSASLRKLCVLAEKIARVAVQIFDFVPLHVKLSVHAQIEPQEANLLKLSAIKGFLSHTTVEYISYVNAEQVFTRKGLSFDLEIENLEHPKTELLIEISGNSSHEKVSVGAVLYDSKYERLCSINEFLFEIEPTGSILIMQNHDKPGVIGAVGSYLASHAVNIAQFELSRNKQGGMAMSLIRIDGEPSSEVITGLSKLPNLISAKMIGGL